MLSKPIKKRPKCLIKPAAHFFKHTQTQHDKHSPSPPLPLIEAELLCLKAPSGPSAGLTEPNAAPPGGCPVSTQSGRPGTNEKAGLTQQKQMQREKQSQVCKKEEEKSHQGKMKQTVFNTFQMELLRHFKCKQSAFVNIH